MQKGEFQKVNNALEALNAYPQFETPKIALCRIACKLQLGNCKISLEVLDQRKIAALVDEMIKSSRVLNDTLMNIYIL